MATGGLVTLCPPGVELFDDAEARIREMLVHDPDIELAYADGIVEPRSGPPEACHRPGFSPDRLRAQQYLGPVLWARPELVAAVDALAGGPEDRRLDGQREGQLGGPLDHRVVRELADRCQTVAHLPQLLYRTTVADPPPAAEPTPRLVDRPLVSVVMPTMGVRRRVGGEPVTLCIQAIDSLAGVTTYRPLEIVVVTTPGTPEGLMVRVLAALDRHPVDRRPVVRFCPDDRLFNFADACNRGAVAARGEVLVFLNDDTAAHTPDWLDRMVARAIDPGVGAVGARLLHEDGSIQHNGIWSRGGQPVHRYQGFRADHPGHLDSLAVAQNCVAVTGACLAVEADKFRRAGGFCSRFPSSYNDVDLCLKLDALGHRTVVDPAAVLYHYEASSRDPIIEDWELDVLSRRWRRHLIDDPNDNPNHLAPGADEFPPPDPAVTLERQRRQGYGFPARIWRRPRPVTDLIDLERDVRLDRVTDEETHVL